MVTKGSVLVVDDEVNLCRILGAKLAKSGYSVVTVHDGLQAVEKVRESDFDVVLLDLILPKMDGLAALAEIRGMRDELPVIVMTACENAEALEKAKAYGVSAYVNKPFDLDNLVALVASTSQSGPSGRARKLPDSTVLFAADQPVTLEVQGSCPKIYGSRILEKNERTFSVLAPCGGNGCADIHPRTSIKIGLGGKDAYYSFVTQVLKKNDTPEPVLVLDKPSVIYRVQRREHPRFPVRIPVLYAIAGDDEQEETAMMEGETRDISGRGACILVPEEILPGEMLRVELRPKAGSEVISTVASVVRSRPNDEPGSHNYLLGCHFVLADGSLNKLLSA